MVQLSEQTARSIRCAKVSIITIMLTLAPKIFIAILFSCSLCKFYLSSKSCKKTCQTSEKYCGISGCSSSSISISTPTEPAIEITDDSKNKLETHFEVLGSAHDSLFQIMKTQKDDESFHDLNFTDMYLLLY